MDEELVERVEAQLIWQHRDALTYNLGKVREPAETIEIGHAGDGPAFAD